MHWKSGKCLQRHPSLQWLSSANQVWLHKGPIAWNGTENWELSIPMSLEFKPLQGTQTDMEASILYHLETRNMIWVTYTRKRKAKEFQASPWLSFCCTPSHPWTWQVRTHLDPLFTWNSLTNEVSNYKLWVYLKAFFTKSQERLLIPICKKKNKIKKYNLKI